MNPSKSHYRPNKRIVGFVHRILLIAMWHSTFFAPSQGIIYAYFHVEHNNKVIYSNYSSYEVATTDDKDIYPIEPQYAKRNVQSEKSTANNSNKVIVLAADIKEGIIGTSPDKPIDNPSDNLFKVFIDRLPAKDEKVYLSYDLFGVKDHNAVARSINDRLSIGGYLVKKQSGWSAQKEEIYSSWLKKGENHILFTIPQGATHQYKIKNLRITIEKTNQPEPILEVSNENLLLVKDNKLYVKGFLRGNYSDVKIFAGNALLEVKNNEFEGFVTLNDLSKRSNIIPIKAIDKNGLLGQELLIIDNLIEADHSFPIHLKEDTSSKIFNSCTATQLFVDGASLSAADTTFYKNYELSITKLRAIDIAPMESGMINVTKGGKGYRFLPDGTKFDKPVTIALEYDPALLPAGYSPKDIKSYFFDTHSKRWKEVERDSIDANNKTVISRTNHFTDYINGIIQAPESPETSAFMPTMMNDIKAADPSAEIALISPPEASQKGDANLSYPIKLPAGRNGMQPQLALQYSNEGGNGWLGQGWSLNVPALTIDTRWGAPVFDPSKETELYSLGGDMLMYPYGYLPHRHQDGPSNTLTTEMQNRNSSGTKVFYPRKQGSFAKIERLGNTPSTYYWKVTNTDGTISWYGGKNNVEENAVIRAGNSTSNSIAHWALYMVEDVYGNNMKYTYTLYSNNSGNLAGGKQLYLSTINYTGHTTAPGNYKVEFVNRATIRPDITINSRLGFKQLDYHLLDNINIYYQNTLFRSYRLHYTTGKFSKSLLDWVAEYDGAGNEFYRHTFEYYDDVNDGNLDVYFSAGVDINFCGDPPTEGCATDTDGDGVCNEEDNCDTQAGPAGNNGCPCDTAIDTDGDSVNDCVDNCDTQAGPASNNGCPQDPPCNFALDSDGDGVNNCEDQCINVPGPATNLGCPCTTGSDNDGDGVCDTEDNCDTLAGPATNDGCPCTTGTDTDGDGVCDTEDNCDTLAGPATNDGCPCTTGTDTDGDGVCDTEDNCDTIDGPATNDGCPCTTGTDTDGDGVCDTEDNCDTVAGPGTNDGCPCTTGIDTDGDGICDTEDDCDTVAGPGTNNGCPCTTGIDTDGDGICDTEDDCDTVAGPGTNDGCPCTTGTDTDGDGICDTEDDCDTVAGPATNDGCPCTTGTDTDGDGVCDTEDNCDTLDGPASNDGCPCTTGTDIDGDGVCDTEDNCDTLAGPGTNDGCPCTTGIDTDGDGICDTEDDCDTVAGPGTNDGCPCTTGTDTDGDGICDTEDDCDTVAGPGTNDGCPCTTGTDTDGDGICDSEDDCDTEEGPASNDGCPEICKEISFTCLATVGSLMSRVEVNCNVQVFANNSSVSLGSYNFGFIQQFNQFVSTLSAAFPNTTGTMTSQSGTPNSIINLITTNPNLLNITVVYPNTYPSSTYTFTTCYAGRFGNNTKEKPSDEFYINKWLASGGGMELPIEMITTVELNHNTANEIYFLVEDERGHVWKNNEREIITEELLVEKLNKNYGLLKGQNSNQFINYKSEEIERRKAAQAQAIEWLKENYTLGKTTSETKLSNSISLETEVQPAEVTGATSSNIDNLTPSINSVPNLTFVDNTFSVSFQNSTPIGDPDCPSFINTDFLIQGQIPSFASAGSFLGSSKSKGLGGGFALSLGIGCKPVTKSTTFGGQFNVSGDSSQSFTALIDIDGDGLEDNVIKFGGALYYRKHIVTRTYDANNNEVITHTFSPYKPITGINEFYKAKSSSSSKNFQVTFGFNAIGGFAGIDNSKTQSETNVYFSDGNGDGLIDVVNNGTVLFNRLNSNGNPEFINDSQGSPNLIIKAAPMEIEVPDEYYEGMFEMPIYDIVKVWEAPYYGKIRIDNSIELLDLNQEVVVTIEDRYKDIYDGDTCLLFGATLNSSNSTIVNTIYSDVRTHCQPWLIGDDGALYVNQGQRIYFRAHSKDNNNPKINWNPTIQYVQVPGVDNMSEFDENGLSPYNTSYSDGFMLSKKGSVEVFPGTGTANITWTPISVNAPSDEVIFEIYKREVTTGVGNSFEESSVETDQLIYRRVCPMNTNTLVSPSTNMVVGGPNISNMSIISNNTPDANNTNTVFYFKVSADSNVRWKEIEWKPVINCTITEQVIGINSVPEGTLTTQQALYPVPDVTLYKVYNRYAGPMQLVRRYARVNMTQLNLNSGNNNLGILPTLNGIYSGNDSGRIVFVVKRNGVTKGKRILTINGATVNIDINQPIDVGPATAPGLLEIGFYSDDTNLPLNTPSILDKIYYNATQTLNLARIAVYSSFFTSQPYNVKQTEVNFYNRPNEMFGPMYRQWGQFGYSPEAVSNNPQFSPMVQNTQYGQLIVSDALTTNQDPAAVQNAVNYLEGLGSNITPEQMEDFSSDPANNNLFSNIEFFTLFPKREFLNNSFSEKWHGANTENYASPLSYRCAGFYEVIQESLDNEDEVVQAVLNTGAYGINKYNDGRSKNIAGGVNANVAPGLGVGASGSKSIEAYSHDLTDYIDINGDRYPDIISKDQIQYTLKTGGLVGPVANNTNLSGTGGSETSRSTNETWGLAASGSFNLGEKGSGNNTAGTGNGKPRFVMFEGSSSTGISGNFSKGDNRSHRMFADINGDGLADMLERVPLSSNITVRLNYGNGVYDTAQVNASSWGLSDMFSGDSNSYGGGVGVNLWNGSFEAGVSLGASKNDVNTTLIDINGDGFADVVNNSDNGISVRINKGNGFMPSTLWSGFNLNEETETVSSSKNIGGTGALVLPIPLTPICIKLIAANASGSESSSTNRTRKKVSDFDGDGYPDLIEEIGPGTVRVHHSTIRRTNMLKSVTNPLGGRFTVDYEVKTPTYDNPNAKWLLKNVVIEDGYDFTNDGVDIYSKTFEYEDGYYDRRERDFYGYGTVRSIDHKVDQNGDPISIYRTSVTKYHNRSYYLNGMVKESYVYKGSDSNQLFTKSVNTYQLWAVTSNGLMDTSMLLPLNFDTGGSEGRKSAVPTLAYTENYIYELGNSPLISKVIFTYDERARVVKYDYQGDINTDNDNYTSDIIYYSSPGLEAKNIHTVPQEIIVKDNGGQVKRHRKTANINDATGDIGTIQAWISGTGSSAEWAETQLTYDIYGNLEQITLPENEAGDSMFYKYIYDSNNHKLVVETQDAYGYASLASYDYRFDKVTETTDISGNKMQYTYDNYGRLTKVRGPKEIAASKPYTILFNYYPLYTNLANSAYDCVDESDFVPVAITSHYDPYHTPNDIQTYTFIDGLGRPVQIKKDIELNTGSPESPTYEEAVSVSGKVTYDEFGRSVMQYHPWYENKACNENLVVNEHQSQYYSEVYYDEIDRPVKTVDPEGNEANTEYSIDTDYNSYPSLKTKAIIDQNGSATIITETYKDVNGRVTSTKNVLDDNGTSTDIWTKFHYNSIGELLSYTDNENISTGYVYDRLGRKTILVHPDNGTTKYFYDKSGKMTKVQTSNLAANTTLQPEDRFIKYEYYFNRPVKVIFPPTGGTDNIANVYYEYGTTGNQKGRLVHQIDATGEQYFEYGNMGEVIKNTRTVVGPNIPTRTFETLFRYDSWNRIQEITYPDGENVAYEYNKGGNVSKIIGNIGGNDYEYIKRIDYDHYEQRTYQLYGNNTETFFDYSPALRRLNKLNVKTSSQEDLFNNIYAYDKVGNVTEISNTAVPNTINLMGGDYRHNFMYDNMNRLTEAGGRFTGDSSQQSNGNDSSADYSLGMKYNTTHGIAQKTQQHIKNGNTVALNSYDNQYNYIIGTHMLEKIVEANTQFTETFAYDNNGNMVEKGDSDGNTRKFYWDEANRLRVVEDQDAMQHYIYDAGGGRVLKASSSSESVYENGTLISSTVTFDGYTTYPSSLIVVNSDGKYSKHYYSGSQRIVSRIGEDTAEIFETSGLLRPAAPQQQEGTKEGVALSEEKVRNLQINDLTLILQKAKKGVPAFAKYEPETGKETAVADDAEDDEPNGAKPKSGMAMMASPEQFPYHSIYFYHPDHLGTSTYLTDANGQPYQFFLNLPFGETMAEQHSLTEDYETPYKFNGKELDSETGMYYYGARYYDPKTSIWLSTDPLMEKYPGFNPYAYCYQNPINVIDPTGMEGVEPSSTTKNFVIIDARDRPDDEALQLNIEAVKKLDPSVVVIKAKNKNDMLKQIKNNLSEGEKIGNLIIAGHGGYENNGTFIGGDYISSEEQFRQLGKDLSKFMTDDSNIVLTACHSGGGASLDKSTKKLQALANSSGATVYGNMSWGAASEDRFSNDGGFFEITDYAAFDSLPSDYNKDKCKKDGCQINAANNVGNWRVTKPNSKDSSIIKNLYFTDNAEIKY